MFAFKIFIFCKLFITYIHEWNIIFLRIYLYIKEVNSLPGLWITAIFYSVLCLLIFHMMVPACRFNKVDNPINIYGH